MSAHNAKYPHQARLGFVNNNVLLLVNQASASSGGKFWELTGRGAIRKGGKLFGNMIDKVNLEGICFLVAHDVGEVSCGLREQQ